MAQPWRRLPIQIRFNDVDRLGHVNNNSYFSYYDLGKEEYLNNILKVDYHTQDVAPVIANLNARSVIANPKGVKQSLSAFSAASFRSRFDGCPFGNAS